MPGSLFLSYDSNVTFFKNHFATNHKETTFNHCNLSVKSAVWLFKLCELFKELALELTLNYFY